MEWNARKAYNLQPRTVEVFLYAESNSCLSVFPRMRRRLKRKLLIAYQHYHERYLGNKLFLSCRRWSDLTWRVLSFSISCRSLMYATKVQATVVQLQQINRLQSIYFHLQKVFILSSLYAHKWIKCCHDDDDIWKTLDIPILPDCVVWHKTYSSNIVFFFVGYNTYKPRAIRGTPGILLVYWPHYQKIVVHKQQHFVNI
jgi:hypothetical protein